MSEYNKCYYCGGKDIKRCVSGFWLNDEKQTATIEVECENCGKAYEEVYKFEKQKELE